MFTGIVNGIGTVLSIKKKKKSNSYMVQIPFNLSKDLKIGASVAHNGCCLTIRLIDNNYIVCDAIEETLKNTNLAILNVGDKVNIERSVKYGDEIGGHIISGHIINTIQVSKVLNFDNNYVLWLKVNNMKLMKYIFYKGFICIDGISLTVGDIIKDEFSVHIIPQTLLSTTIKDKKNGSILNLEIDFYTKTIVDTTERLIQKRI
ncbi:riboflavin synthase subunit alpha [Buchnera aphidicola]|uniref:riboflavin synthase subunit alpha n=1 Tax=Buchnera aphidicola TaxID=9 RepID=UPI0034649BBA